MKRLIKKTSLVLLLIVLLLTTSCINGKEKKEFNLLELQKISILNTLSCSFKNVVTYEVPQSFIFIPLPSEKYFLEYTATIKIGVDMKELEFDENTKTIKIPKAHVLEKPNYIIESMKEYKYQKQLWTNLDINVSQQKLSESLDELRANVEGNSSIMNKAQGIALNQIEALIDNVYTVAGKEPNFKYELK